MIGVFAKWHDPAAKTVEPSSPIVTLPPGQRLIEGFPRFGTRLARPAPVVPPNPVITIHGAVTEAVDLHPGHPSEARTHRPLSLRGGLVGHEPALGGGAVRDLLSHHH